MHKPIPNYVYLILACAVYPVINISMSRAPSIIVEKIFWNMLTFISITFV